MPRTLLVVTTSPEAPQRLDPGNSPNLSLWDRLEPVRRTALWSPAFFPRSVHSPAQTNIPHSRPASGVSPTNPNRLDRFGFVPQTSAQAAPSCARCAPSPFFQAPPESAFRPLSPHPFACLRLRSRPGNLRADCTNLHKAKNAALAEYPHNAHKHKLLTNNWLRSAGTCAQVVPVPLRTASRRPKRGSHSDFSPENRLGRTHLWGGSPDPRRTPRPPSALRGRRLRGRRNAVITRFSSIVVGRRTVGNCLPTSFFSSHQEPDRREVAG